MHGSARLQAFLEGLLGLSGTQWRVILSLLVCANLIVYGALGGLLYRYVLSPPSVPASEMEPMPTPTLRPTYTPTWTATPTIAATATGTTLPTFTATHVPTFTPTMEPTTTFTATLSSQ